MSCKNKIQSILSLFFLVITFFVTRSFASAADVTVSAIIPDTQAPSVPILIAPSNGALLNDNTPSFQWYESFDNVALSHYVFYLNGSIVYNNIPLLETENSSYILEYDSLNGVYTLTPKNALSDRDYTWKIVAVDYANLSSSSDIWSFTIDTLAPNFVLTKIGDTSVNISAGNVGSVPSEAIIIFRNDATANEPILLAYGEKNSTVQLTVTIPNDATQTFVKNIDENGYYEIKLGILPRNTDIKLDFIITDQVGHVSVLEKVYFRIELQYWPTATATPSPTTTPIITQTLSPKPSIGPSSGFTPTVTPSVSFSPTTSLVPSVSVPLVPTGFIPIIPPREVIHEISDEIIEVLPTSMAEQIRTFLRSELWSNLAPLLGLLLLLGFYLFALCLLLSKFILDFSLLLLKKVILLLFPFFSKAGKNLVFDYRETVASPLVKVELLDKHKQILDFKITNLRGNFNDFDLPNEWSLRVKDSNFYYPIGDQKPMQLDFWHFYQGQEFNQENYHGQAVLIPTLRAAGQEKLPFFERLRIFVLYLLEYPWWFLAWSFLLSLVFSMRYAGLYNVLATLFYVFIFIVKMVSFYRLPKTLTINAKLNNQEQFSDNLVFSLFQENKQLAQSLVLPFEFSKSQAIKHVFTSATITAFAKNFALTQDEIVLASQKVELAAQNTDVPITLKKIK